MHEKLELTVCSCYYINILSELFKSVLSFCCSTKGNFKMNTEPKEFNDLIACWRAMPKEGRQPPRKTTFKPVHLKKLMPHLFLLERCSEKEMRVKILGAELETLLNKSTSKHTVFDTLLSSNWQFYSRFMQTCGYAPCGGRFSKSIETEDGLTLNVDSLGVPLADQDGTPRYMLGVMVTRPGPSATYNMDKKTTFGGALSDHEYIDLGHGIPEKNQHT